MKLRWVLAERQTKKTAFILLMLIVPALLAADVTELSVWNMPVEADKLQRKVWEEAVEQFQQQYPTVKINGISREYKPQEFVSVMASGTLSFGSTEV